MFLYTKNNILMYCYFSSIYALLHSFSSWQRCWWWLIVYSIKNQWSGLVYCYKYIKNYSNATSLKVYLTKTSINDNIKDLLLLTCIRIPGSFLTIDISTLLRIRSNVSGPKLNILRRGLLWKRSAILRQTARLLLIHFSLQLRWNMIKRKVHDIRNYTCRERIGTLNECWHNNVYMGLNNPVVAKSITHSQQSQHVWIALGQNYMAPFPNLDEAF